jgi:hypothetical protein
VSGHVTSYISHVVHIIVSYRIVSGTISHHIISYHIYVHAKSKKYELSSLLLEYTLQYSTSKILDIPYGLKVNKRDQAIVNAKAFTVMCKKIQTTETI